MRVTLNGGEIAYRESGQGQPLALLLVHGFPLDSAMWEAQLQGLASHAHVIAPDLRGHGESALPAGPVGLDQHADDLAQLLERLGHARAVVAGLSMGGYVALALWRRRPEMVAGLALVDTRASADTAEGKEQRNATIQKVRTQGVTVLVDDMLPRLLAPANLQRPEIAEPLRAMILRQPAEGMIGALEAMRDRVDSTATLATLNVPVSVVVGEQDAITPPAGAGAMAKAIPAAALVTIPAAGHMSPMENPEAVNQALAGLISRAMR